MRDGAGEGSGEGPGAVYRRELERLREAQEKEQRRDKALGWAKLGMALLIVTLAVVLLREPGWLWLVAVPVAGFAGLAVLHDKVIRAVKYRERTIGFYERGLGRLEGRWAGMGETGERFLDPAHPYARDLNIFGDIFGEGSVFELLSTARTRAGEETLARWLLGAAERSWFRRQAIVTIRLPVGCCSGR